MEEALHKMSVPLLTLFSKIKGSLSPMLTILLACKLPENSAFNKPSSEHSTRL